MPRTRQTEARLPERRAPMVFGLSPLTIRPARGQFLAFFQCWRGDRQRPLVQCWLANRRWGPAQRAGPHHFRPGAGACYCGEVLPEVLNVMEKPPRMEDSAPAAVFPVPPWTAALRPLAVLWMPPVTTAKWPMVLVSPTTSPPTPE